MKELLTPTAVQIRSDSHNNCSIFESHKAQRQKIGLIWPTMPPEMCLYHLCSHISLAPALESNWQNTPDFMTRARSPVGLELFYLCIEFISIESLQINLLS